MFNGLGNILSAVLSIRKHPYFPLAATFFGIGMMLWITSQVAFTGYKNFLQPLYFTTGMVQALLGIVINKSEKNSPAELRATGE